jgi:predicted site-specific integrase-resolvase
MKEKLLKEKEVQKALSVSRTFLWRLRKEGKIKAVMQGKKRVYYRESAVKDYIDSLHNVEIE